MRRHAHNLRRAGELIPAEMVGNADIGERRLVAAAGAMARGNATMARAILAGAPYGRGRGNAEKQESSNSASR